jgi:hypothetical protein
MAENKDYLRQRIAIFAGEDIDPTDDPKVAKMLRAKFNVFLPQRRSLDESLAACICDHEIISLIAQYRSVK